MDEDKRVYSARVNPGKYFFVHKEIPGRTKTGLKKGFAVLYRRVKVPEKNNRITKMLVRQFFWVECISKDDEAYKRYVNSQPQGYKHERFVSRVLDKPPKKGPDPWAFRPLGGRSIRE